MTSTQVPDAVPAPSRPGGPARHALGRLGRLRRFDRVDALAAGAYLVLAGLVCSRLWLAAPGRVTTDNVRDHTFFQFVFTHAARAVTHLDNPLFSTQLNAPLGVNM